MRLDHCCLNVRDMDRAITFYETHFKMKLLSRREIEATDAEIAFVGYGDDGMKLELTHWRKWAPEEYAQGGNFDHIAVRIDTDLREFVEGLRSAGVKIAKEPFQLEASGTRIAFVHDTEDNWVEIIERKR